jgi:hypothetical protein
MKPDFELQFVIDTDCRLKATFVVHMDTSKTLLSVCCFGEPLLQTPNAAHVVEQE